MHDEPGGLPVRTLQGIDKLHDVIGINARRGESRSPTAGFRKKPQRLTASGAVQECILFRIGQSLAELVDDVSLKIESGIVEKLLGYLDGHMKLMGIKQDL